MLFKSGCPCGVPQEKNEVTTMKAVLWNGASIVGILVDNLAIPGAALWRGCVIANPSAQLMRRHTAALAAKGFAYARWQPASFT
jgi:hypothetical protein